METTFYIQNLKCGGCAKTISSKLKDLEGIEHVEVVLEDSAVRLAHEEALGIEKIQEQLSKLGYPTQEMDNSLLAKARSVVSCASGRIKN